MSARAACFWLSAAGGAWILVGYPAFLTVLRSRPWPTTSRLPRVSVLIPAYREHEGLRRKLRGLGDLDYPGERLEVVVAVDEDEELARVAEATFPAAVVIFSSERAGKALAINRAVSASHGEIILMTDANNVLQPQSVRAAIRHFGDPSVWAVAGRRGEEGSAYDSYEDLIRRLETRSGSVAAASGEFIAVRRERFVDFPPGIVNDDFWLLCQLVRGGGRVVYEPAASSTEEALSQRAERVRRSRMGAGRTLLLSEMRGLPAAFVFRVLSHKYGRLALPFLLVVALASSLSLVRRPTYAVLAVTQGAAYGLGALALAGRAPGGRPGRLARACAQFMLGNAAVGVGVLRGLRGRQSVRWEPVT